MSFVSREAVVMAAMVYVMMVVAMVEAVEVTVKMAVVVGAMVLAAVVKEKRCLFTKFSGKSRSILALQCTLKASL